MPPDWNQYRVQGFRDDFAPCRVRYSCNLASGCSGHQRPKLQAAISDVRDGAYARQVVAAFAGLKQNGLASPPAGTDRIAIPVDDRLTVVRVAEIIVNVQRVTELRSLNNGEFSVALIDGTTLKLSRSYRESLDLLIGRRL
jgi:hypothetical protein